MAWLHKYLQLTEWRRGKYLGAKASSPAVLTNKFVKADVMSQRLKILTKFQDKSLAVRLIEVNGKLIQLSSLNFK